MNRSIPRERGLLIACEAVGLTANAVAERVRRLLASGTIRRLTAEIDPAAS